MLPANRMLKNGPTWEHDLVSTALGAAAPLDAAMSTATDSSATTADRIAENVAQPGTFTGRSTTIDRMASLEHPAESPPVMRASADPGEAELVRRAQLGSSAAFEQLVLRRGPQLHRYLVVRLRDETDALDALQETLTAAWQGLPRLEQAGKFWPWLCGIASNKAADTARGRVWTSDAEIEGEATVSGVLEIREAVAALPEHFRQVLLLRYLLGLSEEEVAKTLGIRVGTVKSRSARARKALVEVWS
jgi:RNA polymerase sigma factor (sigma-70 family)